MPESNESFYREALSRVDLQLIEFEGLAKDIFSLGTRLTDARIIDNLLGMLSEIGDHSAKILDSSWLYFALDNFFIRRLYSTSTPRTHGPPEFAVLAGLESLPRWAESQFKWDTELTNIALGHKEAWSSDAKVEVFPSPRGSGIKFHFLRFLENLLSKSTSLKFRPRSAAAFLGMHHLVTTDAVGRILKYIANGGMVFGDSFPDAPASAPDRKLRKALQAEFKTALRGCDSKYLSGNAQIHALANYLSLAIPISHFEVRRTNWAKAVTRVAVLNERSQVYTAIGLYYSSYHSFILAAAKRRSAELVGVQHGGYYGYMRNMAYHESVEMQCLDRFLSWGWNGPVPSVRPYRARIEPIGSHYLQALISRDRSKGNRRRVLAPRAILCATDYPERLARVDSPITRSFMEAHIWPYSAEIMAKWLKQNSLGLDLKPYAGFFSKGQNSAYTKLLLQACVDQGVDVVLLDAGTPARNLIDRYAVVLWDTLGTGFWESLALDCRTFLVPAARVFPMLVDGVHLSDAFNLDWKSSPTITYQAQYEQARAQSAGAIKLYGRAAYSDFFSFVSSRRSAYRLNRCAQDGR